MDLINPLSNDETDMNMYSKNFNNNRKKTRKFQINKLKINLCPMEK